MDGLFTWASQHPGHVLFLYVILNAAVQALPRPDQASLKFYVWLYQFANLTAMNLKLVAQPRKVTFTPPEDFPPPPEK